MSNVDQWGISIKEESRPIKKKGYRRRERRRGRQAEQGPRLALRRHVLPDHQVLPEGRERAGRLRGPALRSGVRRVPQREVRDAALSRRTVERR